MYSARDDAGLTAPGCPIRTSPDQSLLSGSPKLFAASHVLHRLLAPRHPPYALSSLTTYVVATKCAFIKTGYPYAIVKDLYAYRVGSSSRELDPRYSTVSNIVQPTHTKVELIGIEPTASALPGRRSPN